MSKKLVEKTVGMLAKPDNKTGTRLAQVAEYLPPIASAYRAHVGEAQ